MSYVIQLGVSEGPSETPLFPAFISRFATLSAVLAALSADLVALSADLASLLAALLALRDVHVRHPRHCAPVTDPSRPSSTSPSAARLLPACLASAC